MRFRDGGGRALFDLPDGTWDCAEQELDGLTVAVKGGVLYGQSIDIANVAFLPKPFSVQELAQAVQRVLAASK